MSETLRERIENRAKFEDDLGGPMTAYATDLLEVIRDAERAASLAGARAGLEAAANFVETKTTATEFGFDKNGGGQRKIFVDNPDGIPDANQRKYAEGIRALDPAAVLAAREPGTDSKP